MSEQEARLELFAAIEGGSEFWAVEIADRGPGDVRERLLSGGYLSKRESSTPIVSRLRQQPYEKLIQEIAESGGYAIFPDGENWPEQLNDLSAPPIALIVKGAPENIDAVNTAISIVGTRNPTPYGVRIASELGTGAADRSWAVISGGAYGIDTAAHKGALAGEGITVAVMASGISQKYPAGNARLFEEISESGLLISEVMPHVSAVPHRFLTRNRLIAALSRGTIVVEAAYRSGSLRTARDAAEIFRPVMAIPGLVSSPASEGCHKLINERQAELVTSISDVMELVTPLAMQ